MTDKELLEAAARAAGLPTFASGATGLRVASDGRASGYIWNPLTADGDALRLAVELMLTITMRHHECEVFDEDGQFLTSESLHCPPDARQELVRRAIVRAAAEIGSSHNAEVSGLSDGPPAQGAGFHFWVSSVLRAELAEVPSQ